VQEIIIEKGAGMKLDEINDLKDKYKYKYEEEKDAKSGVYKFYYK